MSLIKRTPALWFHGAEVFHKWRGQVCLIWIGLIFMPCQGLLYAQKKKNKEKTVTDQVKMPDDTTSVLLINLFEFPNINKVADYYDKGKLQKIREYEEKKDWEALYRVLKKYVRNFGVQNFYKDTYLIWRLAKLTELIEGLEKAKPLYKMVLRHHHQGINLKEIELYYDSLDKQEAQLYVPLDYYYELVEHRKAIDTLRPPRRCAAQYGRQCKQPRC